jgi:hypothetical protein
VADQFNILDQSLDYLVQQRLTDGGGNIPRNLVSSASAGLVSQRLTLTYFTAQKSAPITKLRTFSGATAAAATPTLCRIGVYSVAANGDLTLVADIASDTALWASQNAAYTKNLSATWNMQAGQRYATGYLIVTATTAPQLVGTLLGSDSGGFREEIASVAATATLPRMAAGIASQADLPASLTNAQLNVAVASLHYVGFGL